MRKRFSWLRTSDLVELLSFNLRACGPLSARQAMVSMRSKNALHHARPDSADLMLPELDGLACETLRRDPALLEFRSLWSRPCRANLPARKSETDAGITSPAIQSKQLARVQALLGQMPWNRPHLKSQVFWSSNSTARDSCHPPVTFLSQGRHCPGTSPW